MPPRLPCKIHPLHYLQISAGACILVSWRLTRPGQQSLLGQHKFKEDLNLNTFRQRNGSPMGHIFTIPFFFLNLIFCIRVKPINNVVMVLGTQRRDSAIHTHMHPFSRKPPLPPRLQHNVEQISLCYTVGPCFTIPFGIIEI